MKIKNITYHVKKSFFLIPLLILLSAPMIQADDQSWLNNSLQLSLNPKIILRFIHESRNNEVTFMYPYLSNVQGGMSYQIFGKTYVALLYRRQISQKTGYMLNENRYTCEAGWKKEFEQRTIFDVRFRTEARTFADGNTEDHLRFRLRLRFTYKATWGSFRFRPFIATEPFGDTLQNKIHQNRFYLGVIFPLSEKIVFSINYIRQDTSKKETLHILSSGFQLKF